MRLLLLSILILSTACEDSKPGQSTANPKPIFLKCAQLQSGDVIVDDINQIVGEFVECKDNSIWIQADSTNYYFGIDESTGNIRKAVNGLIYSDVNCTSLIGEEHNYTLTGYSGDFYVFEFLGQYYEYANEPINDFFNVYKKDLNADCFQVDAYDVMNVNPYAGPDFDDLVLPFHKQ